MKTTLSISTLALGAFIASAAPTPAMAAKTVFHGATCENVYQPDFAPYGEGVANTATGIANTTNSFKYVVCPIDRLIGGGGSLTDVEVSIRSNNTDTWCRINSTDRYGNSGTSSPILYAAGTGAQTLDFGSFGSAPYEGMYYAFCVLGPNAKVTSIAVDEN